MQVLLRISHLKISYFQVKGQFDLMKTILESLRGLALKFSKHPY